MAEKYIARWRCRTFLLASTAEKERSRTSRRGDEPIVSAPVPSELDERLFKPNNVVFLIDVRVRWKSPINCPCSKGPFSPSWNPFDRLIKLPSLPTELKPALLFQRVTGNDKERVKNVIDTLHAGGVTAGSKGLQLAYDLAKEHLTVEIIKLFWLLMVLFE